MARKTSTIILLIAAFLNVLIFQHTPGKSQNGHEELVTDEDVEKKYDTTIIITSNLIPTHPSIAIINRTIDSLRYIRGLPKNSPIIITVDGVFSTDHGTGHPKNVILSQYIETLRAALIDQPHITILTEPTQIMLVGNVKKAMDLVETEFVYVLQHDIPFISDIDHRGLIRTFHNYPNEVRLVRFSRRKTLVRRRDNLGLCGDVSFEADGMHLSKTHTWSDQNHLTRKTYYDEMFTTANIDWDGIRYMEKKMVPLGYTNCSYWGTYLYGKIGDGPMTIHLNGRLETNLTKVEQL